MSAPTRCAWKLHSSVGRYQGLSLCKDEILCAACAEHTPALPMTEDAARLGRDAVTCDRCDTLIFPEARQCLSCCEWIEDPWDWSIDYCRACAESAESVHRSDMQQAARFGTASGHP